MTERWLVADVGATNTRVGLAGASGLVDDTACSIRNSTHSGLAPLLSSYLANNAPGPVSALCAGVAGPVRAGQAQLTNHSWFIDRDDLEQALAIPHVTLINDLQAQGYALEDLRSEHVTRLFPGTPAHPEDTRLVLGLGTGCNIAVVYTDGKTLHIPPSETGHTSLPYCGGALGELITVLHQDHPHTPIESALSGPGLQNIWRWLGGDARGSADIIAAFGKDDPRALKALTLFCDLFGRVAGDIALAHLPLGGVYLIGGLARAIAPLLSASDFHTRFCAKGPYADIMRDIPIFLIDDDMAALRGGARCLRQTLNR